MKRQFEDLERNSTYLSRDRLTEAAKAYDVITEVSCETRKHGGDADEVHRRLAAAHRRHIDQMRRDLAEVEYINNRAAFDGARAV